MHDVIPSVAERAMVHEIPHAAARNITTTPHQPRGTAAPKIPIPAMRVRCSPTAGPIHAATGRDNAEPGNRRRKRSSGLTEGLFLCIINLENGTESRNLEDVLHRPLQSGKEHLAILRLELFGR